MGRYSISRGHVPQSAPQAVLVSYRCFWVCSYSRALLALFCRAVLLIIITSEPIIHLLHCFLVHAWKHMSIDTQGATDMAMPRYLLDNVRGKTKLNKIVAAEC